MTNPNVHKLTSKMVEINNKQLSITLKSRKLVNNESRQVVCIKIILDITLAIACQHVLEKLRTQSKQRA